MILLQTFAAGLASRKATAISRLMRFFIVKNLVLLYVGLDWAAAMLAGRSTGRPTRSIPAPRLTV